MPPRKIGMGVEGRGFASFRIQTIYKVCGCAALHYAITYTPVQPPATRKMSFIKYTSKGVLSSMDHAMYYISRAFQSSSRSLLKLARVPDDSAKAYLVIRSTQSRITPSSPDNDPWNYRIYSRIKYPASRDMAPASFPSDTLHPSFREYLRRTWTT